MSSGGFVAGAHAPSIPSSSAAIIDWPSGSSALDELAGSGIPRLAVVDDGSQPPFSADCCQDWMWRSGGEAEMRLRLHQLALRGLEHGHGRAQLDALGMLRVGLRSVHLPAKERALAMPLLGRFGEPVPRDQLIAAAWPAGIARLSVLATRISALRSRVRWLGLEIHGSSATGYCITVSGDGPEAHVAGFEDDVGAHVRPRRRVRAPSVE